MLWLRATSSNFISGQQHKALPKGAALPLLCNTKKKTRLREWAGFTMIAVYNPFTQHDQQVNKMDACK